MRNSFATTLAPLGDVTPAAWSNGSSVIMPPCLRGAVSGEELTARVHSLLTNAMLNRSLALGDVAGRRIARESHTHREGS